MAVFLSSLIVAVLSVAIMCHHNGVVTARKSNYLKCLPITSRICTELSYNESFYPNTRGHKSPEDADLELHQFYPLINVRCSEFLKELLCSVYFPPCDGSDRMIAPCRQLCEVARNDCESLMNKFGFQWPSSLKCDGFPIDSSQGTCFRGKTTVTTPRYTPSLITKGNRKCLPVTSSLCNGLSYNMSSFPNSFGHQSLNDAILTLNTFSPLLQYQCSEYLKEFLCFLYLPPCYPGDERTLPCRQLCEAAKKGCDTVLNEFGYPWPSAMNCDRFPDDDSQGNCYGATKAVTNPRYTTPVPTRSRRECLPITHPMCAKLSYNESFYPNILGHKFPVDAALEIHQFYPLIKVRCSEFLKEFLCSVYFPPCDGNNRITPPCRELCEVARNDCESLMNKFGFQWPFSLKCDNFLVDNSQGTCFRGKSAITIPRYKPSTQGSLSEKVTPTPTRVPRRKRISFRKFITMFRKSLGQVNKDLSSLYSLLAEE